MKDAAKDKTQKDQIIIDKNIVWSLLKDKSSLASNEELLELIMSLSGTIIIDKDGHVTNVPSLISSQALVQALLGRDDGSSQEAFLCKGKRKLDFQNQGLSTLWDWHF